MHLSLSTHISTFIPVFYSKAELDCFLTWNAKGNINGCAFYLEIIGLRTMHHVGISWKIAL